jgi:hypothetical protein
MNIHEFFKSNYVAADDLKGQVVACKINRIEGVKLIDDETKAEKTRPVLFFEGFKKGFLCAAKINAFTIVEMYGEDVNAWIGKVILLYPDVCMYKGKLTKCIRVKMQTPVDGMRIDSVQPSAPQTQNGSVYQQLATAMGDPLPSTNGHAHTAPMSTAVAGMPSF